MKIKRFSLFMLAIVATSIFTPFHLMAQNQKIQVTATVIGRLRAGGLVLFPGQVQIPEYILVRVAAPSEDLKKDQYIQVRCDYSRYSIRLPEDIFKQSASWKFTLRLVVDGERKIQDVIASERKEEAQGWSVKSPFDRVPGAEKDELPSDVTVPLYDVVAEITPGAQ